MNKLLAIIKREYLQRVRSRMFVVWTILGPLMLVFFSVVPALMFGIKAGDATHIVVVDETGKMYERVRTSLMDETLVDRGAGEGSENSPVRNLNATPEENVRRASRAMNGTYRVEPYNLNGRTTEDASRELSERVRSNQLDGYIIIPRDVLNTGQISYHGRNTGDVVTMDQIRSRVAKAIRDQIIAEANVPARVFADISRPVQMEAQRITEKGSERDSGAGFILVLVMGFLIYLMLVTYGQVILSAVVEEKETRIAELLFSSVRSFTLMMGKLIGVSLVALTQYSIWAVVFTLFALYGVGALAASGIPVELPQIPPSLVIYFIIFFLLGYFIYATIYALVGAMVTTAQEGGQVALPVIFLLMIGFYLSFAVMRSPNSSFAFWASMIPFWSPITMLVRIVTQQPPFWEIALSIAIGVATILLLLWLAARVYRIGMLMYGKRASIPEVIRWVRQP
ncbi:MAG TPA: ABC transporter permease [Pyrinomonadaceae bacterium]|nr:ABC transporter permease [Pyrinomonadaceae bacterium]